MSVDVNLPGKASISELLLGNSCRENHMWLMTGRLMIMETVMIVSERRMVAQVK